MLKNDPLRKGQRVWQLCTHGPRAPPVAASARCHTPQHSGSAQLRPRRPLGC